jgi:hypothetical protein
MAFSGEPKVCLWAVLLTWFEDTYLSACAPNVLITCLGQQSIGSVDINWSFDSGNRKA